MLRLIGVENCNYFKNAKYIIPKRLVPTLLPNSRYQVASVSTEIMEKRLMRDGSLSKCPIMQQSQESAIIFPACIRHSIGAWPIDKDNLKEK